MPTGAHLVPDGYIEEVYKKVAIKMLNVSNEEIIRLREMWKNISEVYDERSKRLFVAAMAKSFGHGGLTLSHKITGMSIMGTV